MRRVIIPKIRDEFAGAELGDPRRSSRLGLIADSLASEPTMSFPSALASEAELEGFYRFINSEAIESAAILQPHFDATMERARRAGEVVVIHDTTSVEFTSVAERRGLGYTTAGGLRQGFFAHVALVLAHDGLPIGVGHVETYTRSGRKSRARTQSHKVIREDRSRESMRWLRGVDTVEDVRDDRFSALHVADAEGDFFELLGTLHEDGTRFVIRAGQLDRRVWQGDAERSLRDVVDEIAPRCERRAPLSKRQNVKRRVPYCSRRKHPNRSARIARLSIGATTVRLPKTKYSDLDCDDLSVNVVRVWERDPPSDEPAVEWILFTTEEVSTRGQLARIVDVYRLRWTIEEFFKALKTGCALERRQIESYEALKNVLGLFIPIAYRLLLLRGLQRRSPTAKVSHAFDQTEVHLMANAPSNASLPWPKTVGEGLIHLARLGGHLRNNGPPGWLTLSRGYEKLLVLRLGWEIAQKFAGRSDQS
ncbi:MAG: IS4 family transposase [Polyangiales bacterium]